VSLFEHRPHPHVAARREQGPVKVADQAPKRTAYARFNSWFGLRLTNGVGSMTCAYLFTAIALVSLPSAIESRNVITIVSWVAQTLIQLTLLSVILFGQGLQAQAADARADATWKDAEAMLHGLDQQARHLAAQDTAILAIQDHLQTQDQALSGLVGQVSALLAAAAHPPAA
jgi:hypothetical protein